MPKARRSPHIWDIVERFYRSERLFREQHDRYEELVHQYVEREGKPRDEIRLEPEELSGLLNFKSLESLRDEYLFPLKEACHALFRSDDSTDFLDRVVNDIFHEISILKEEHYNLLTYSPDEREQLDAILDEVHEMFPLKLHRMKRLFDTAQQRLEGLLPRFRQNPMLLRSLFLQRESFVAEAHEEGLIYFYRKIFGEDRAFEGFRRTGDSFFDSSFFSLANDCYLAGEEYLKSLTPTQKRNLDSSWKEVRDHCKRRQKRCQARLRALEQDV